MSLRDLIPLGLALVSAGLVSGCRLDLPGRTCKAAYHCFDNERCEGGTCVLVDPSADAGAEVGPEENEESALEALSLDAGGADGATPNENAQAHTPRAQSVSPPTG